LYARVIRVRLRQAGSLQDCVCSRLWLNRGTDCIIASKRGQRFGTVVSQPRVAATKDLSADGWHVVRRATPDDYQRLSENEALEREAFSVCQKRIAERELAMKLVKVEYAFDRSQALFYFTAETRVDFRELVRDLAHQFRTRIELKQVGVRDEAKILGGIGYCGRELCCSRFLRQFEPVSKRMARDQNLTLNPSKISGICGRLLCCLVYEHPTYEELRKDFPQEGKMVETPAGAGSVKSINPLKGTVEVSLSSGVTKHFVLSEVEQIDQDDQQGQKVEEAQSDENESPPPENEKR